MPEGGNFDLIFNGEYGEGFIVLIFVFSYSLLRFGSSFKVAPILFPKFPSEDGKTVTVIFHNLFIRKIYCCLV